MVSQLWIYEGRSINKLQNGIILLIFKIWKKIRDICFVGNLFLSTSCKFYCDDVIIMTSLALWTQSVSVVFYPVFFHSPPSVKQHCELQKNEQVQQADLFKPQTVTFIFQHIFRINLNIYHTCQQASEWLMQKRCLLLATGYWPGRSSSTFCQPSAFSKLLTLVS